MEMLRLLRGYPRCIYCRAGGLWAEPHLRWAAGRAVRAPVTQVNGETEDFSPTIALSKTTRNDIHKGSRSLTQRDILATMPYLGVCCANLKDNKALMKMGLGLVLVGHVNFLLGALVHGAVLRHINVHEQARTMVYAIANVIAIVAGLFGIIDGIITIVLSKNKKNKILRWVLLFFSFLVGLLAIASAIGLSVSTVQAIIHKGKSLLTHCNFPDEIDSARITFECPFDPTRIYATTLILWIPLIVMSVVETVFAFRCFAVCTSSLYLCACRKKPLQARRVRIQQNVESVPAPPETEEEPAEEDELLDGDTAVAQSDWL